MQVKQDELLLIYDSRDIQDLQTLGYAKSLKEHKVKTHDVSSQNFTDTQLARIVDLLDMEVEDLIDRQSETYLSKYANRDLSHDALHKALLKHSSIIKTPIAIYHHDARLKNPFKFTTKEMESTN